jgi:TRAP-type mannitol/chloroaromatic compound transport system substrate-binding protein
MAKYDADNPAALKRLIAGGAQLRQWPREIMVACYKAMIEVNNETSAANPAFKKIYESMLKFRSDEVRWFSLSEGAMSSFMEAAERASEGGGKKK